MVVSDFGTEDGAHAAERGDGREAGCAGAGHGLAWEKGVQLGLPLQPYSQYRMPNVCGDVPGDVCGRLSWRDLGCSLLSRLAPFRSLMLVDTPRSGGPLTSCFLSFARWTMARAQAGEMASTPTRGGISPPGEARPSLFWGWCAFTLHTHGGIVMYIHSYVWGGEWKGGRWRRGRQRRETGEGVRGRARERAPGTLPGLPDAFRRLVRSCAAFGGGWDEWRRGGVEV